MCEHSVADIDLDQMWPVEMVSILIHLLETAACNVSCRELLG
ncbi:hypothetical protein [Vibrio sp. NH-UV-68]